MKTNRIQTLFMGLLLTLSAAPCAFAQEAPLQGFDEYVNKALKDWEVPGAGVAIVKGDKVVLARPHRMRGEQRVAFGLVQRAAQQVELAKPLHLAQG